MNAIALATGTSVAWGEDEASVLLKAAVGEPFNVRHKTHTYFKAGVGFVVISLSLLFLSPVLPPTPNVKE